MAKVIYTFKGISFTRAVSGSEFPRWFAQEAIRQVDAILDSSTRYIDVGGVQPQPLQLRAVCASQGDADALVAAVGSKATLAKAAGESASAVLVSASQVFLSGLYAVDVTFERA